MKSTPTGTYIAGMLDLNAAKKVLAIYVGAVISQD